MENHILQTGGSLKTDEHCIICKFPSPRLVLSTSLYNGGYLMADAVFNHRLSVFVHSEQDLPGGSMENYLALAADARGLNRKSSTGLLTSARMHCRSYRTMTFKNITVEAVATAGVEKNAVRAGDPACYYEDKGSYHSVGGTVNILAFTNINLPRGAMAKALLSITEAKTAALQELAVISPFTLHPATGTGTDGIILACDPVSPVMCTDTGTQSKLGELFCRVTKAAVKQALAQECKIDPWQQGTIHERLRRLGLTSRLNPDLAMESSQAKILLLMNQSVWQEYCWGLIGIDEMACFIAFLETPSLQPLGSLLSAELKQKISGIKTMHKQASKLQGEF